MLNHVGSKAQRHPSMSEVMERAIMASTNGIMIVEAGSQILTTVFVNPAFETITGFSSDEILGLPPGRLHQGDSDQVALDELRSAISTHRPTKVVLRNYRKDGTLFWNELTTSPVHDEAGRLTHFVGILNDISDRVRAESERNTWAARLDALTSMSAEGLVTFDESGLLSYVNDAFLRLSGLTPGKVEGLDAVAFDRLFARQCDPQRPCRGAAEEIAELMESGHIIDREVEVHLLAPRKRVLLRLARMGRHGTSLLLYFRDVTKARELDEIKSEFLATAAHELRTPITSILGYTELLLVRDFDAGQRRELHEIILRQAQRVTGMLNELLDLARIEARRGKDFNRAVQELRPIVDGVVNAIAEATGRTVNAMPDESLLVEVDGEKMHQALLNVLSNALKFSPPAAPVTISIRHRSDCAPAMIGVTIEDRGIGMREEQLARLGERFFRADASGKVPGTGLGISLTKEIADLHGGTLEVTSEFGKGSCFTLWLPRARPDRIDPRVAALVSEDEPSLSPDSASTFELESRIMTKILLVDDHPDIRRLIRVALGKSFEVAEAEDGVSGLETARRIKPDLVVLDVMMPGELNGLEVLAAIKSDPTLKHTRVIMVTARGQARDYEDGMQRGADAYFIKPFSPLQLVAAIKETLGNSA